MWFSPLRRTKKVSQCFLKIRFWYILHLKIDSFTQVHRGMGKFKLWSLIVHISACRRKCSVLCMHYLKWINIAYKNNKFLGRGSKNVWNFRATWQLNLPVQLSQVIFIRQWMRRGGGEALLPEKRFKHSDSGVGYTSFWSKFHMSERELVARAGTKRTRVFLIYGPDVVPAKPSPSKFPPPPRARSVTVKLPATQTSLALVVSSSVEFLSCGPVTPLFVWKGDLHTPTQPPNYTPSRLLQTKARRLDIPNFHQP